MSLRELYQEMILDHGRTPRNFYTLKNATHKHSGYNPLCGDQLTIYIVYNNDILKNVAFEGTGCAICIASASMMTDSMKGKTYQEFKAMFKQFHELVTQGTTDQSLGKLDVFAGVFEFPIRVKCATLAWHALQAALNNDLKPVSTE